MNATPLQASEVSGTAPLVEPSVDAYLARLAREQARFLDAVAGANATLESAPLARVAAVHGRLTREFLDAQRAIVKRRAETESAVARIDRAAALEVARVIGDVGRSTGTSPAGMVFTAPPTGAPICPTLPAPREPVITAPVSGLGGPTADLVSLARLVDDAFDPADADGVAMKRQLRELLDEWWHLENQEHRATIDDAHARAAMAIHGAHVEAAQGSSAELTVQVVARESARQLPPIVAAIDTTRHEDLDDLLASLLDDLDDPAIRTVEAVDALDRVPDLPAPSPGSVSQPLAVPEPVDSLTDASPAPQEAFDRFWGTFTGRSSKGREWILGQVLFPAVAVIAVLALVLAVVG